MAGFIDQSEMIHEFIGGNVLEYTGLFEMQEKEFNDLDGDWELAQCLELAWKEVSSTRNIR